jgi:hypothetical protein
MGLRGTQLTGSIIYTLVTYQYADNSECTKTILQHHQTRKHITLWFRNTPDITETPLR